MHNYPAENILPLLAISFTESLETDPCLVYQFMPQGSVSDRLKCRGGTRPLTWEQRSRIAIGTAKGLVHLHAIKPPIVHGDINSGNILLDKYFEPRIGDFGLARGGAGQEEGTHLLVTSVKGTQIYLPDDYMRSRELTPAVDTFCFGIFLFELVCGKSPSYVPNPETNMKMREIMLDMSTPGEYVDPNIPKSGWSSILFYTGKDCALRSRRARPTMDKVLAALERLEQSTSPIVLQWFYDSKQSNFEGSKASVAAAAKAAYNGPTRDITSTANASPAANLDSTIERNIPAFLQSGASNQLQTGLPAIVEDSRSGRQTTTGSTLGGRDETCASSDPTSAASISQSIELMAFSQNLPRLAQFVTDELSSMTVESSASALPDLSLLKISGNGVAAEAESGAGSGTQKNAL
jgi:serine/threonine protein kinase